MNSKTISETDLIINPDGSIYHLHVKPGEVADLIFTVGDPNRVKMVAKYFDSIEFKTSYREFNTVTGYIGNKRMTVISTGIGTDNIDICINELDALFNIDFETRTIKDQLTSIKFIRLGTSGCIQKSIPVDSILLSRFAFEIDNLLNIYNYKESLEERQISKLITPFFPMGSPIRTVSASDRLLKVFAPHFKQGITYTATGFYAPQGRRLRLKSIISPNTLDLISEITYDHLQICNIEMESSVLFGLSRLLGHEAISINALVANRALTEFSKDSNAAVDKMIQNVLEIIIKMK